MFGASGQVVRRLADLAGSGRHGRGVLDDDRHRLLQLAHHRVEVILQLAVVLGEVLGQPERQVSVGQFGEAVGQAFDHERLLAGQNRLGLVGSAPVFAGLQLQPLLFGIGLPERQAIVLEHLDRGGHVADLVATANGGHLGGQITGGETLHGLGHAGDRNRDRPRHQPAHQPGQSGRGEGADQQGGGRKAELIALLLQLACEFGVLMLVDQGHLGPHFGQPAMRGQGRQRFRRSGGIAAHGDLLRLL